MISCAKAVGAEFVECDLSVLRTLLMAESSRVVDNVVVIVGSLSIDFTFRKLRVPGPRTLNEEADVYRHSHSDKPPSLQGWHGLSWEQPRAVLIHLLHLTTAFASLPGPDNVLEIFVSCIFGASGVVSFLLGFVPRKVASLSM